MKEINYTKFQEQPISIEIMNLISAIHEYKGRQELYLATKPQVLDKLVEVAKIQSTESSNKIEGIYTSDKRLREIVQKKSEPRNRNEKEIAGYREVLEVIHESYSYIRLKPNDILTLHQYLYKFSATTNGGRYKMTDNYIEEEDEFGNRTVRFKPVPAVSVPDYMEALCRQYEEAVQHSEMDPLLIIPCVILDFLCIHPFNDGNGRLSRLLTLLLLYKAGYLVGKYISIEMIVEKSKETYYEALYDSSLNWHENTNDYLPFIRYTLGTILRAYREFEERFTLMEKKMTSSERVFAVIERSFQPLGKTDIVILCPELSQKTIERSLKKLTDDGRATKLGAGKNTTYIASDRV